MDSLSQIVLGGAVGEVVLGKKVGNKAIAWGALAGTIPDLDVLPSQFMETVARIEFHRSITHSVLFAILLAPLLALLAKKIHKNAEASHWQWSQLFFWSLFTHAILDCFTTWGTQLFWPFLDVRIAWNTISVVDPLYTVPFLALLVVTLFKDRNSRIRRQLNWAGLLVSTAYLGFTLINQSIMTSAFEKELANRDIRYSRLIIMPTIFNNALWRGIAETEDGYYIGFASIFDKSLKPDFHYFPAHHNLWEKLPRENRLQHLAAITNGYYLLRQKDEMIILSDLRFGQTGGWDSPDAPFIFNYTIFQDASGKVHITRARPPFNKADFNRMFSSLFARIKGRSDVKPENAG